MPVVALKCGFRKGAAPVAEQGLDATEMAGSDDVREPVAVDVARGESRVADIRPSRCNRTEAAFTVAMPHLERRAYQPGCGDEIQDAVTIEIDNERLKAPFLPLSQRDGQRIAGKSQCGSRDGGAARNDADDRGEPTVPSNEGEHEVEVTLMDFPSDVNMGGGWASAQPPVRRVDQRGRYGWNIVDTALPSLNSEYE
jgi:hypothetical protein